jgi:hypothetical protein
VAIAFGYDARIDSDLVQRIDNALAVIFGLVRA